MNNLDTFFNPKSIAVIGASKKAGSVGGAVLSNIASSQYRGKVYPVNIKGGRIGELKVSKSVLDIGKNIDLAIIATPAKTVASVVRECGRAKIRSVVIISAGFSETGKEGIALSRELVKVAREYNVRILGSNCLGFINPRINLNASFTAKTAKKGKIAFISQSGALCSSILDWSLKNNVGFSYFISVGEMSDIEFSDLIDYLGNDNETESILIYMESLKDARRFLSAARQVSRTKPIVILKSGRSKKGALAAKSHTGSLAGNDHIFSAAFDRAGIIRVDTIVGLFHVAKILSMQPKPMGSKILTITNAGGPGVIATDAVIYEGGGLAPLSKTTVDKLNKILPRAWSHGNPVDILGDASKERYRQVVNVCLEEKNVDAILIILTPQAMTNATEVAKEILKIKKTNNKILMASWMGGDEVAEGRKLLERGNIPIFRSPEDAIRSFMYIYKHQQHLKLLYETPATIPHAFKPNVFENKKIFEKAIKEGRDALNEAESKQVLSNYDIPIAKYRVASNSAEAGKFSFEVGFPVAMKVLSSDILHKTDGGGVHLNVRTRKEASDVYDKIINSARAHNPDAKIDGVIIEAMVNKKYELIIGAKKDSIFGSTIVFGMGGVAVEVFKDTRVGLPPLNMALALRMIQKTKIYKLLKGYRGMPGVSIQAIQFLLYKFSYLLVDFPEIKEMDINPFVVDEHGGVVLDAKIIIDTALPKKMASSHPHLSISPYPKNLESAFRAKNRNEIFVRPVLPEDEPLIKEMFKAISLKTRKYKFFDRIKDISHDTLQMFTQIDYDRDITMVAEVSKNSKRSIVAMSRLVKNYYSDEAELAVVVVDDWQRQKVGGVFIDKMIEIARGRKLKKVHINFYSFNKVIRHLLEKRGFLVECHEGECIATKKLS